MFLISDAMAAAPQAGGEPSMIATFLPLLLIFGVMYFLLIRPQVKRQKEHKKLVESIAKGDEVITNGGMLGRVVKISDAFVTLELADHVMVVLQRQAIASVMPKGTLKDARDA